MLITKLGTVSHKTHGEAEFRHNQNKSARQNFFCLALNLSGFFDYFGAFSLVRFCSDIISAHGFQAYCGLKLLRYRVKFCCSAVRYCFFRAVVLLGFPRSFAFKIPSERFLGLSPLKSAFCLDFQSPPRNREKKTVYL